MKMLARTALAGGSFADGGSFAVFRELERWAGPGGEAAHDAHHGAQRNRSAILHDLRQSS